jgi:hypothetical protein
MAIRAVIDTSSLVPFELRRSLQQAVQLGVFVGIWSPWIIAELNRVLVWRWIKDPPPGLVRDDLSRANEKRCGVAAKQMMGLLLSSFELVDPRAPYPPAWETLTDEWDHPIWAAAKLGHAQYVISENTRHYPPQQSNGRHVYEGIEYMSARAFLSLLTSGMGD